MVAARTARARPAGPARADRDRARAHRLDPGHPRIAHAHPAGPPHRPLRWPRGVHRPDGVHDPAADRARTVQRLLDGRPGLRIPARLRRSLLRHRHPVRQRLVPAEPPGLCARRLRRRYGRHRGGRADRAQDRRRHEPRRPVLDRGRRAGRHGRGVLEHVRRRARRRQGPDRLDVRRALGVPREGQQPRMGADPLLLHGLRRLRRDVPLPAEAAPRRASPEQAGRRLARSRASRCSPSRPARSAAGCRTGSARATS